MTLACVTILINLFIIGLWFLCILLTASMSLVALVEVFIINVKSAVAIITQEEIVQHQIRDGYILNGNTIKTLD